MRESKLNVINRPELRKAVIARLEQQGYVDKTIRGEGYLHIHTEGMVTGSGIYRHFKEWPVTEITLLDLYDVPVVHTINLSGIRLELSAKQYAELQVLFTKPHPIKNPPD